MFACPCVCQYNSGPFVIFQAAHCLVDISFKNVQLSMFFMCYDMVTKLYFSLYNLNTREKKFFFITIFCFLFRSRPLHDMCVGKGQKEWENIVKFCTRVDRPSYHYRILCVCVVCNKHRPHDQVLYR